MVGRRGETCTITFDPSLVARKTQLLIVAEMKNMVEHVANNPTETKRLVLDLEDEIRLLNTNCKSFLILTHGLANKMRERNKGGLVFLSSLTSVSAISRWANYAASKGFDLMFAEALNAELKDYNIDVMALCPGLTYTELVEVSRFNKFMTMNADAVVSLALNKLGKATIVVPGIMNKISFFLTRLNPRAINTRIFSSVVKSTQEIELKNKQLR